MLGISSDRGFEAQQGLESFFYVEKRSSEESEPRLLGKIVMYAERKATLGRMNTPGKTTSQKNGSVWSFPCFLSLFFYVVCFGRRNAFSSCPVSVGVDKNCSV